MSDSTASSHVRAASHGSPCTGVGPRVARSPRRGSCLRRAHCLVLGPDRPLTPVYWLNVNDPGFFFMALVKHANTCRRRTTAAATSSTWVTIGRWTTRS